MGGLREDMTDVKNAIMSKDATPAAVDKKGKNTSRMNCLEDMLPERLSGLRKAFNKATFSYVIFSQVVRLVLTTYKGASSCVIGSEQLMDVIMFSSKEGKAAYQTDVGKATKTLRRAIVNTSILKAKSDTFGMFREAAASGNGSSAVPKWLTDVSICDLSIEQVEIGCARQEEKSQRAAAKRVLAFVRGDVDPSNEELGQLVGRNIYASVMDMFVSGRKNSRIVMFEEVGYMLRNWEGHVHKKVNPHSLRMQWKAATKSAEKSGVVLPYATTVSDATTDVDQVNRMKLKKLFTEEDHLQLIVSHDVLLRGKGKDSQQTSQQTTDTTAAANKKTWTRSLSLIEVSLRYIAAFANFEKKADATSVLKYDKYSIMAAYRLAVALRRVIDVKMKCKIRAQGKGGHASSSASDTAAATAEFVRIAEKICDEMLTPSSCEITRAFDRNVNAVNDKVYEDENDEELTFMEELDELADNTGGRLTLAGSMDDDLHLEL